jgi:hypothetical protein
MYEAWSTIILLAVGLLTYVRAYFKSPPGSLRKIILFLCVFGVGAAIFHLMTWNYPIIFHVWATGAIFTLLLLLIAGVK